MPLNAASSVRGQGLPTQSDAKYSSPLTRVECVFDMPTPSVAISMPVDTKSTQALLGHGTVALSKCTACFVRCATRRQPFSRDKSQNKAQQFFRHSRHRTNKCLHAPIAQVLCCQAVSPLALQTHYCNASAVLYRQQLCIRHRASQNLTEYW